MKRCDITTYEGLQRYLAEFANFGGDPVPYDFVGTFMLFVALLSNLASHHLDADLDALIETDFRFSDQQRAFLQKLIAMGG